jgi:hypothetical protein
MMLKNFSKLLIMLINNSFVIYIFKYFFKSEKCLKNSNRVVSFQCSDAICNCVNCVIYIFNYNKISHHHNNELNLNKKSSNKKIDKFNNIGSLSKAINDTLLQNSMLKKYCLINVNKHSIIITIGIISMVVDG